jgi:hypothetical protein
MNTQERIDFFMEEFEKMMEISATKGVEYANDDHDANHNFKDIGKQLGINQKTVLWIYVKKHLQSVESYLRKGSVISNEPIEGRIHDIILYNFILLSLLKEEKQ